MACEQCGNKKVASGLCSNCTNKAKRTAWKALKKEKGKDSDHPKKE